MSSDVVIMVADDAYLNHAKSLMVNFRRQGGWQSDFCLISPSGSGGGDLEKRGIHVFRVPDAQWDFMVKFWVFAPYFQQWSRALAVDIDIMVQGSVQKIFDGLAPRLPAIVANLEDGSILGGLKQFDTNVSEHAELYAAIEQRFPHVTQRMFNMAFLFYDPKSIPDDTADKLRALHQEFKMVNPTNADQMLVNLLLYDRLEETGKDFFTFFGFDYPENRIVSDYRKWRGDEVPSILHYTRWMAPWIIKQKTDPEMGGYRNHRLGRICHELYAENLNAFEQEFPIIA